MIHKEQGYEKHVHDYRVQFMLKKPPGSLFKKPCFIYVFKRTIEPEEKETIMKMKAIYPGHIHIESIGLTDNAVCIYSNVTNRNVDLIFYQMYERIEKFRKMNLLSLE